MKTRKTVIAVLIAALLVSAALIVGCMNQFDGISGNDAEDNYQIPEGKGIVKLKISDPTKRTIMPDSSTFLTDMYFTITCTATSGGANETWPASGRSKIPTGTQNIILTDGTYTIVVSAYSYGTDGTDGVPIAGGTKTGVIVSSSSVNVDINLIGITTGTNKGTFFYNIEGDAITKGTYSPAPSYATKILQIINYGGSQEGSDIDLDGDASGSPTGSVNLDPGFYTIKVILSAGSTYYQDRVVDNVMHIYPSMTTYYGTSIAHVTIPAPIQDKFTVSYDLDGVVQSSSVALSEIIANAGTVSTHPSPTSSTHEFVKWVISQGGSTAFGFGSTKIFKDTKIWAEWTPKAGASIYITFVIDDGAAGTISDMSVMNSKLTFNYAELSATVPTQSIILITTMDDPLWTLNGLSLSATTTSNPNDTIKIDSTSNASFLDTLASGSHRINVSGKVSGIPFNTFITFTLDNN